MRFKRTSTKMLLALSVTAIAMMATAGSAFAWNVTNQGIKMYGTITISLNGGSSKTCTASSNLSESPQKGTVSTSGSVNYFRTQSAEIEAGVRFTCTDKSVFRWDPAGGISATEGKYMAEIGSFSPELNSPYGKWVPSGELWLQWVNASGGVQSHITLTGQTLGEATGGKITATGTLYFTTLFGGTLTVP